MIYLWVRPIDWTDKNTIEFDDNNETDRFLFLQGNTLSQEVLSRKLTFNAEVSSNKLLPNNFIRNTGYFPIISQKVVDLLSDLVPEEVQFVPVEIHCTDVILTEYKGLNITHKITGIDREKSIYTTDKVKEEYISGIKYLTYIPNCMGNFSIARDADYHSNILVSEELKLVFERANISKGIEIMLPEKYYDGKCY